MSGVVRRIGEERGGRRAGTEARAQACDPQASEAGGASRLHRHRESCGAIVRESENRSKAQDRYGRMSPER